MAEPPSSSLNVKSAGEWVVAAAISVLVSFAVVSPFFFLGTASGHDVEFHMASWLDAAEQWKQGVLLPRWAEWPNYGFGEPRFIFYPPLSWLFGALLGSLIPWNASAGAFIILTQIFAGLSTFALLRRIVDSRWAALFGSACFAANPYALVIVYTRSDFAELLANALFPLLFLAALRLCGWIPTKIALSFADVFLFVAAFCAVWLTNAPAAVIATYSMTFLFVFAALQGHSWRPLLRGASGMLLGFGLAGFYLIPAIYEQRWVNIAGALGSGLAPSDNFLYAKTADAEHDAFNQVASNIVLLLFLWVVVAAAIAWRERRRSQERPAPLAVFPALSGLSLTAILLMSPVTSLLWRLLPELRFVQFPWRWMSILAVCLAVFLALSARRKLKWLWLFVATATALISGRYLVKHTWWDTEDMPTLVEALQQGAGFEGTDEYDPLGDDHTDLPQKAPRARFLQETEGESKRDGREIFVDRWDAERRLLRAVTPQPARVAMRVLDYPAWRVLVNGKPVAPQHTETTAQMVLPVQAGESKIEIEFTRTTDRALGGWLSALTALISAVLLIWERLRASRPPG